MDNCLLVIDLQEEFMQSKAKEDLDKKLEVSKRIISDYRNKEIPIIYTRFGDFGEILSLIQPKDDSEIFFKRYNDAFRETDLSKKVSNCETLDVIGCNAEACVSETIDSAIDLGHKVRVYEDALMSVRSSKEAILKFKIKYLFNSGVRVTKYTKNYFNSKSL